MAKIAMISAILEKPEQSQSLFNEILASFKGMVKGRMGIPFEAENIAVICITVLGELDDINHLTGRLGRLPGVSVKTAISKKEV